MEKREGRGRQRGRKVGIYKNGREGVEGWREGWKRGGGAQS